MLKLNFDSLKETLPLLSKHLGAQLVIDKKQALLTVDNEKAKGYIRAITIFEGLESLIFDLTFHQELQCSTGSKGGNSLYFFFCQEGHISHKFDSENDFSKFEFQQNVVLKNNLVSVCDLIFPAFTTLKMSVVLVSGNQLSSIGAGDTLGYQGDLLELFRTFPATGNYRHLGSISPYTAIYVKQLLADSKEGLADRLYKKSLVLNILASQILKHNKDVSFEAGRCPLRQIELDKIVGLAAFISDNISEPLKISHLTNLTGMSPKKLQDGFNYLYNKSVANYIGAERLKQALHLLDTTDLTISEVVYRIGLSSRSYFTKIFKNEYGFLPSEYKGSFRPVKE